MEMGEVADGVEAEISTGEAGLWFWWWWGRLCGRCCGWRRVDLQPIGWKRWPVLVVLWPLLLKKPPKKRLLRGKLWMEKLWDDYCGWTGEERTDLQLLWGTMTVGLREERSDGAETARGVLGSVLLAGKGKEDGERCAGWVGKRLFWDRVLFSREGATAWADQRQGRGLCDGLLAVEGKKLGRLRWVGGGCLGSDGFRFRVCFVSPFFFKIAPPLKNQCSLVFIGKVLLGFQTSPSTFPFLLFSSFFVNFDFSYFLYFWKRANINIDSMRKINDFKNDAWKVERVPNVFENFNSFWDDAKNAKNDTNV